jgi:hypothetical protein
MRNKLFALILALTVVSWAQTATQTTPATPSQSTATENAKCACCDKMADSKDGHAACMRNSKMSDGKEMASCCGGKETASCCGKDAKSCMKDEKNAASCCKDGCGRDKTASCCDRKAGKECGKGCCGSNKSEKPA